MPLILIVLATLLIAVGAHSATENSISFQSGTKQVTLLELYTSEGCSSCPPADAWLGKLAEHPDLWSRFVPVAFHVDYWNYLGWDDAWSKPENSQRQRKHKTQGGIASVYTPGFVANGQEWRGWFKRKRLPEAKNGDAGTLQVNLTDGTLTASYEGGQSKKKSLQLSVAVLGFDIETAVASGENRGRILNHQFVVMDQQIAHSRDGRWRLKLPNGNSEIKKQAIAVWITEAGKLAPLQAAGSWLN